MNNFTSMSIEIKRTPAGDNISIVDGKILTPRSTNYISIRAELPVKMRPRRNMFDENLSDEMEEDTSQIRYIWFMFDEQEFELFARGPFSHTFEDGFHRLEVCGDSCLFYDSLRNQNIHRESHGKTEIAYYNANIPIFFRRYLLKIARFVWRGLEAEQHRAILASKRESWGRVEYSDRDWSYNAPEVRLNISQKQREHFTKLYGQGTGRVEVEFGGYQPEKTKARLEIDMKDPDFVRHFENKIQICRNSTSGFHQTAKLHIRLDSFREDIKPEEKSPGYYWVAKNYRGQMIMNGGIFPHYDQDTHPHWSSHT